MSVNIFDEARRLVPARAAAGRYGFSPDRAGYIRCPFHAEKSPSLKLYGDGGWYCFGCHAGGDSIDFVAKLLGLSPLEAVRRLDADFSLALPLDRPAGEDQRRAVQRRRELAAVQSAFEDWRGGFTGLLNAACRAGHQALRGLDGQRGLRGLSDGEALALQWLEALEDWSGCLSAGSMKEQMQVFRERRAIGELCGKILCHI